MMPDSAPMELQIPTFTIATIGCKVNQSDSEAITASLIDRGLRPADNDEQANVVIVNTCTVTHLGDRSSRQAIGQGRRHSPHALIVATGCYAQVAPDEVAKVAGVDLVVSNAAKDAIAETIIAHLHGNSATGEMQVFPRTLPMAESVEIFPDAINQDHLLADILGRTRVQVKVQDGCDNRCTYCIVPTARGGSRSRSIADIVAFVQRKERAGIQEIVLTGVHLGDYHPTDQSDLGDLIATLLRETGMPRIRISSLEPEDFKLEWLELWQNPRMCRHLHLPLQSGSDNILRRMARRYLSDRYRQIAQAAYKAIPGLALSTDIIVGFPGETGEDFSQTYAIAEELRFARMHVFRFSPRSGTAAARMSNRVPDPLKRERSDMLLELNERLSRAYRERFIGQEIEVLWEYPRPTGWEGLTDNYIRVMLQRDAAPEGMQLQHQRRLATIVRLDGDGVVGELGQ